MSVALRPTLKKQVPYLIDDVFEALSTLLPKMSGYTLEDRQAITYSFQVKTKSSLTRSGARIRIALSANIDKSVIVEMVATPNVPTQMFDIGDSMTKSMEAVFIELSSVLESYPRLQPLEDANDRADNKNITQQIRDLSELYKDGILTEHEFQQKKEALLAKM